MARPALYLATKVEELRAIDIGWLRRRGARDVGYSGRISWSRNGEETGSVGYDVTSSGLRLRYRCTPYGGSPEEVDEVISVVTTPMHFGGCRHWFRCPSCQRRCRLIYGGAHFRCRICRRAKVLRGTFSAMYRTCQLHKKWRCSIAAGTTAPASSG